MALPVNEREFFDGQPQSTDAMWCTEQQSIAPYCLGRGLDPGAGQRTLRADTLCVDLFRDGLPHVQADARALPFRDGVFDYVCNSHLLEHLPDPRAAIREWLRVVRVGGVVAMVIPDTRWTGGMNTDRTPHLHEWAPEDFQERVLGWRARTDWWTCTGMLDWCCGTLIALQVACPGWSFAAVVRKRPI